MKILILGPGCANCRQLENLVHKVLEQLSLDAEVVKVTDPLKYADYDVLSTPGLVIDGKTVASGRVPSMSEISQFLTSA